MEELFRTDGLEEICVRETLQGILDDLRVKGEKLENKKASEIIRDIRTIVTGENQDKLVMDPEFRNCMLDEGTRGKEVDQEDTNAWKRAIPNVESIIYDKEGYKDSGFEPAMFGDRKVCALLRVLPLYWDDCTQNKSKRQHNKTKWITKVRTLYFKHLESKIMENANNKYEQITNVLKTFQEEFEKLQHDLEKDLENYDEEILDLYMKKVWCTDAVLQKLVKELALREAFLRVEEFEDQLAIKPVGRATLVARARQREGDRAKLVREVRKYVQFRWCSEDAKAYNSISKGASPNDFKKLSKRFKVEGYCIAHPNYSKFRAHCKDIEYHLLYSESQVQLDWLLKAQNSSALNLEEKYKEARKKEHNKFVGSLSIASGFYLCCVCQSLPFLPSLCHRSLAPLY